MPLGRRPSLLSHNDVVGAGAAGVATTPPSPNVCNEGVISKWLNK